MKTLTKRQIERQDFVDNEIFELLQRLLPAKRQFEWDIEVIGAVRDAIQNQIIKQNATSEMRFYPFIKI